MKREVHVLTVHGVNKTAHGLDHDDDVGCLHRNHYIHELFLDKHAQELHHALDHTGRRVAVAAHDAVTQRAVVHTQAHSRVVVAAHLDKGQQRLTHALELGVILFLGKFKLLECACRIHKVSRVDAYTLTHLGGSKRCLGIEVDVGNQRDVASVGAQHLRDLADAVSLFYALCRQPHIVGPGIGDALALGRTGLYVIGSGIGH